MPKLKRGTLQAMAVYYAGTGVWPLAHRRSFEAVTGRKTDWWLVQMVGLLALTNGIALAAGARRKRKRPSPETIALGIASAISFAAIDLTYAATRRISPVYLADALVECAFLSVLLRH
ncbi:MAG: hypothetical protein ABR508_03875 [Candidatus Baltobacteraceae bacterium]